MGSTCADVVWECVVSMCRGDVPSICTYIPMRMHLCAYILMHMSMCHGDVYRCATVHVYSSRCACLKVCMPKGAHVPSLTTYGTWRDNTGSSQRASTIYGRMRGGYTCRATRPCDRPAPTKWRCAKVLIAGMESTLANGSTPCGGPAPIHAGTFSASSLALSAQTKR